MSIKAYRYVWKNSKTKGSRRLLMLALAEHADNEGKCWPSLERLAEYCNTDKRYIIKMLKELEESGEITKEYRYKDTGDMTSNVYHIVGVVVNQGTPPSEPGYTTPSEPGYTRVVNQGTPEPPINRELEPPVKVCDVPVKNLYQIYEQEIGVISPMIADELSEIEKEYPQEWFAEAVGIAVKQNARKMKYITAILKRWKSEGKDNGRATNGRTKIDTSKGLAG